MGADGRAGPDQLSVSVVTGTLRRAGVPFRAMAPLEPGAPDEDGGRPEARGTEAVTVSSFHRAKGLQWPAVWVCGLEAGFVPIAYAIARRLWPKNGAFSTSPSPGPKRELHCSWARQRRASNGAMVAQTEPLAQRVGWSMCHPRWGSR